MKKILSAGFVSVVVSTFLSACGGGGSSGVAGVAGVSKSLTGVAATGAALSNAAVTANCSNGKSVSGTTDANGRFSLDLSGTEAVPPCMLRAQAPTGTFYSYAETDGTVNINPLTDLSVTKALKGDPAAFFGSFGASVREIKTSEIKDAIQFIFSGADAISGHKTSDLSNPFTAPFVIGNDQDKSLDALADSLAHSGTSYAELRKTVVDNADTREAFAKNLLIALVTKKIMPVVISMKCTVADQTTLVKCVVKGKNLTRPSDPITRIESDLGIYVSRKPQQQPKTDSRLPFNPPYCVSFLGSGGLVSKPGSSGIGVFAEELEFTCSSATGNTTDPLTVELVIKNNGRYTNSTNLGFILYEPGVNELVVGKPTPSTKWYGCIPDPALLADAAAKLFVLRGPGGDFKFYQSEAQTLAVTLDELDRFNQVGRILEEELAHAIEKFTFYNNKTNSQLPLTYQNFYIAQSKLEIPLLQCMITEKAKLSK